MMFEQNAIPIWAIVMEQKIIDLQTQLSFQEESIEQMTKTLVAQQSEMYEISQMMLHLQKQIYSHQVTSQDYRYLDPLDQS